MNNQTNKRYYTARADSWVLGKSSTGKEQVAVSFTILTEGATHQRLTWYGYFTDATFDRTVESLRICGWQGDDLADLQGLDAEEVSLVVADEEYEGKVNARVLWVNKLTQGPAVKSVLEGDEARAFAASMRDRVRAFSAAAKKPASKPAGDVRPEPPPLTDADIPF
jgi:hypothetical protein